MPHLYLSRLSEENLRIKAPQTGLWSNAEYGIMNEISQKIVVDEHAKSRGVSSIPDVWARPLLFQSALQKNSQHPLRERLLQEWRGLMSLLALHKIKQYNITVESVTLKDDTDPFSASLRKLRPKGIRLEKDRVYNWDHPIFVIRYDGVPIGAFSPATLVYTATDYKEIRTKAFLPILDKNGFLSPPKKDSAETDLMAVGEWVEQTFAKIKSVIYSENANEDRNQAAMILDLLESWLKDIKKDLGFEENEPIDAKHVKQIEEISDVAADAKKELEDYNLYKFLLYPLIYEKGIKALTDFALVQERSSNQTVIIISEDLLKGNPEVWNGIKLEDLGGNPEACITKHFKEASGTEINKKRMEDGIWIRPEKYFLTDTLLCSKDGNLLSNRELDLNKNPRFIYPFSPSILDYYSPDEIVQKLKPTFEEDSKGNVIFSFELPIRSISGKITNLKVKKSYILANPSEKDGKILKIDPFVVEIFPDYISKYWRTYYLFQSDRSAYKVMPPARKSAEVKFDERERDVYERIVENNAPRDVKIGEIRIVEMQATGHDPSAAFPEALIVSSSDNNAKPLGLIFLSRNQDSRFANTVTVGIDFGTSNTNVHLKNKEDERSEALEIDFARYLRSVMNSDPTKREKLLRRELKPPTRVRFPIPTLLRLPDNGHKDKLNLDYGIYIVANNEFEFPDSVYANLKFENKDIMSLFFRDLLYIIFIKLVEMRAKEVDLRISYPKAFSAYDKTELQQRWVEVFRTTLFGDSRFFDIKIASVDNAEKMKIDWHNQRHIENVQDIQAENIIFETEGIAIGEFIKKQANVHATEYICLDVGGGTTDISIWYEDNILIDASVRLAGQQISDFMRYRPRLLEKLFSRGATNALLEKKGSSVHFSGRLNMVLKSEESFIRDNLRKLATDHDIKMLRQFLAMEFGVIAFYAGILCASNSEVANYVKGSGIKCYWGGNGAKFINWIDFGQFSPIEGNATKILNALFLNAFYAITKDRGNIQQAQSPSHKSEVAGGLSVMNAPKGRNMQRNHSNDDNYLVVPSDENQSSSNGEHQTNSIGVICGENIILKGEKDLKGEKEVKSSEMIDDNMLFDQQQGRTLYVRSKGDMLKLFAQAIKRVGVAVGLFEPNINFDPYLNDIDQSVRGQLVQRASDAQYLVEPIFIMEAKLLLEKIIKGN